VRPMGLTPPTFAIPPDFPGKSGHPQHKMRIHVQIYGQLTGEKQAPGHGKTPAIPNTSPIKLPAPSITFSALCWTMMPSSSLDAYSAAHAL
jgi:hypothetical protein